MKHIKLFEAFTKLNEGGGAGIDFKIENVTFSANLVITSGMVKVENPKLELPPTFDAKGYDDGLSNVKTDILAVDYSNLSITWDKIKDSKIQALHTDNAELFNDIFSSEGEKFGSALLSHLSTFEDLFKFLPDATLNIKLDYHLDYSTMVFRGWVRGEFVVGQTLATAQDWDGEYTHTYLGDERIDELDFDKISFPIIKVTEEFIQFYNDVFNRDYNKDDTEADYDDYYLYLRDTYCE